MSENKENIESKSRPLRTMGGKVHDLYNTYVRNEEMAEREQQRSHSQEEDSAAPTAAVEETMIDEISSDSTQDNEVIAQLQRERDELREQLLRNMAEMDNFRRRTIKEKEELREYANHSLLMKMLPMLDDLHAALFASHQGVPDAGAIQKGVEMIYNKAMKLFEESGVRIIEEGNGQPFNVEIHEALAQIPSQDVPEGHVVQEVQRGFYFRDKVLRHAKVITSAGSLTAHSE